MATSLTGQTLLIPDQANAEVTANTLFLAAEQLGALKIKNDTLLTPPLSPSDFDAYIMPTGTLLSDWSTYAENDVAFYYQGWIRIQKKEGMTGYFEYVTTPERRGKIVYSADRDEWYNLSTPIWYVPQVDGGSAGDEFFTGRYTAEAFNASGTANYAIYARTYTGELTGATTTIAHNVTMVGAANYARVSYAYFRDDHAGSTLSDLKF